MKGTPSRSSPVAWWVLVGLVVYPVLALGGVGSSESLPTGFFLAAVAYLLALYLYYGVSALVYRGRTWSVVIAAVVSIVVAMAVTGRVGGTLGTPALIVVGGGLTGYLTRRGKDPLTVYLVGIGALIAVSVMMYLSVWPELMQVVERQFSQVIGESESFMRVNGMVESQIDEVMLALERAGRASVRTIPASMIMGAVIQYSIGFLLFFVRGVDNASSVQAVKDFTRWKVPFWTALVLIVAIPMRLFGPETATLIADNVILILALYYCLGGLALVEFGLKRFGVSLPVRILFYVFLVLSGLIGLFMAALAGFVDSFADWRRNAPDEIDLKKRES